MIAVGGDEGNAEHGFDLASLRARCDSRLSIPQHATPKARS
jgi:hypothetical protein